MNFIQIIGTQRSGSNLLRAMLNQLPEITAPHPPHILKTFIPLLPEYGSLFEDTNFSHLVNDVCTWVELNPVSWQIAKIDRAMIQQRCESNTLVDLFYTIYSCYAEKLKSTYTCCKSMGNVHQYQQLEAAGLKPYYIFLHRDGRDVACSFKKAIVGEKHAYHIAKQWKHDQEKALEVRQNIPSARFIEVKYHDLITNPTLVLKNLCAFLDVTFSTIMLDYFHAEESLNTARSGKMWENLSHPIIKDNYNKYLKELNSEELQIFETIAGDILAELGYSITSHFKNKKRISEFDIEVFDLLNIKMKQGIISSANSHDIEVRCPQKYFLNTLKKRLNNKKIKEYA